MTESLGVLLVILLSHAAYAEERGAAFVITSQCVSSIEVIASGHAPGADLEITLDEGAARDLHEYTSERIGKMMMLVDGYGNPILKNGAVVREPLPSPFRISGIQTEEEAIQARDRIMSSTGPCGVHDG